LYKRNPGLDYLSDPALQSFDSTLPRLKKARLIA
jgi:hypothetical protein